MSVTLCITAFNEHENLYDLIKDLTWLHAQQIGLQVVIVDNGSTDDTWRTLQVQSLEHGEWLSIVRLGENRGYGGGLRSAIEAAGTETVALLSADRQYPIEDVLQAIREFQSSAQEESSRLILVGNRKERYDPKSAKFVSWFYSRTVRLLLGTELMDVNSQPKIFGRELLTQKIPWSDSFFFDAQLIAVAQQLNFKLISSPVRFVNRRYGKSSWSGQRIKVYRETLIEMWGFRKYLNKIDL
ncbi:MAG: glycosyltransferase family 2 protein [Candidatus Nanopelagicales bacterium]|nr:glycosyltransferase family 2 protein [Candidatus Nanopelagicales bacterium]